LAIPNYLKIISIVSFQKWSAGKKSNKKLRVFHLYNTYVKFGFSKKKDNFANLNNTHIDI